MEGQTGPQAVVEQDVDVSKIESELTGAGVKLSDKVEAKNGHRPISRSQFLFAAKGYVPNVEVVEFGDDETVPEALRGGAMKVRELRSGERDKYENKLVKGRLGQQKIDMTEMRVPMIIASAVEWDDVTQPLFTEKDADIIRLMGVSIIQKVYNVCRKLSDVSDEDEKELMGE
jgi:hypothetical protein